MTHPASNIRAVGNLLIAGLAGLAGLARAEASPPRPTASETAVFAPTEVANPEAAQGARGASPRFVYASGFQGVGYYANPGTATAARQVPAPTFSGNRGQSVGPGVRDWSTGRRGRLHKPWLQPR